MKRILALLLSVVLSFALIPADAVQFSAYATEWYDKLVEKNDYVATYVTPAYYYDIRDGEATITGIYGEIRPYGVLEIPSTLRGCPVVSISDQAFAHANQLTEVILSDSVKQIGREAFAFCEALTTVTVGNGVKTIGNKAFWACSALTTVTIGTGCKEIEAEAFRRSSLTTLKFNAVDCTVADAGTDSSDSVCPFADVPLTTVILGNTVETIREYTFANLPSLTTVTLGKKLTEIQNGAFLNCTALTSIVIPGNVKYIGSSAFSDCTSLSSVTLQSGVSHIDASAFSDCTSLSELSVTDGLQTIGQYAFEGCSSLSEIDLPDTVRRIGYNAFTGTAYYNDAANWNGGLYIGKHFITGSGSTVTVKAGTITIADLALYNASCSKIVLPEGLRNIGSQAFAYCYKLTALNIPDSVEYIAGSVLEKTAYYDDPANWKDGILYVDNHCIKAERESISGQYVVRDGIRSIAARAFAGCDDLTAVAIPASVSVIAEGTFYSCDALSEITLPSSIQMIADEAFALCDALKTVHYRGTAATRATIAIGKENDALNGSTWEYIGGGHVYSNANDNICNICGEDKTLPYYTYTVTDGKATVTDVKVAVTGDVVIPDTLGDAPVTVIAKDAFRNCQNITSVTIPATVTSIGTGAFKGCTALTMVYYNATACETAGSSTYPVFSECTALATLYIGEGVTRIPAQIFRGIATLKTVHMPKSVTTIEKNAFYQDTALSLVRYGGTTADRKTITVALYNTPLTQAKWLYTACEHGYDNACDNACNACGKERQAARHSWDDGVVLEEATAVKTGSKRFTCTVCGNTAVVETTLGTVEDGMYYYDGEVTANAGLVMVDGAYYYVAANGKVKTGRYAISNVNGTDVERGIYYFFEDGTMNTEEGVYNGYYYNEKGKSEAYAGLIEWSGSKYYVNDGGRVKSGRYFISKLNGIVPKKRAYTFYNDGKMLEETRIYEADGFYYEDGIRIPYAGLVEYEGHFFYVTDNGAYVTSRRQNVSNTGYTEKSKGYYYFDGNGYMLTNIIVDNCYYGKDGKAPSYVGVVRVDNKYYYVGGTNGALTTDKTITISAAKTNGLIAAGKYTADTTGVLTAV